MKKLFILLSLFLLTSCGNSSEVTINDKEYKLNDTFYVNLTLDNDENNINICPKIKISKDGEKNTSKIVNYIDYSSENLEVFNYNVNGLMETFDDNGWYLQLNLDKIDSSDTYLKIKLKVKEKGNYHITLGDTNEECFTKYKDDLKLEITK